MRLALAVLALLVAAPTALAEEQLLTLYSDAIQTAPYVHDTHTLRLAADGVHAPPSPATCSASRRWRWSTAGTPTPSCSTTRGS